MTTLHPPTTSPEDRDLIVAHLAGAEGAFDLLFRRYHPRLVAYLRSRVRDRAAAEDLAQESLIRAMRALERFDPARPLWPWLRRIATNAAIDHSRADGRAKALRAALAREPVTEALPPDLEERDVLRAALSSVPARQRAALERCYVDGWRPVDAAAEFGVGSNAFEQLLHRARGNLRRAYLRSVGEDRAGDDRAAAVPWLVSLIAPLVRVAEHVRGAGAAGVRVAEAGLAAAVTVVMVIGGGAPTQPPAPMDRVELPSAEAVEAVRSSATGGRAWAEVEAASPAAAPQGPGSATAHVSDARRPAPPAVAPRRPARPEAPAPAPAPVGAPLGEQGQDPADPLVPATLGGCGTTLREVACATAATLTE